MATARQGFGAIRRPPSKRFQASYLGPDLRRHVAPITLAARIDAEWWLATERRLVETDTWTAPETRDPRRSAPTTLAAFAAESSVADACGARPYGLGRSSSTRG